MKLYDVGENERIQIIAKNQRGSIEYVSTVSICKQNLLFVEPIVCGNQIVNFDTGKVINSVVYTGEDGKPLIWEGCVVKNMVYKNKKYHVLYSDKEGRKLNRRDTYRQFIGAKGLLQNDQTRETKEVIVKDISLSGISFVSDKELQLSDMQFFHLNFEDKDCRVKVQLSGKLVREENVDEVRKVFGGVIKKCNMDLNSYIATKQKFEIAKKRK